MLIPVSTHVPWFSPICPRLNFPFLSFETFLTIRQNSLYVTVCMIARTSYQGYFIHSLSTLYYYNAPSLATRLTGDYRDRTCTGKCGPASLDTRHNKKPCKHHCLQDSQTPRVGLEPTTLRLTAECSTIELSRITSLLEGIYLQNHTQN